MIRKSIVAITLVATCFLGAIGDRVCGQEAKSPVLDSKTRLELHSQFLSMRDASPHKSKRWRSIGPSVMSGRVTDIAHPLDKPYTFYVTTASGGLWKTENEGTTWIDCFPDAPSASSGAVAVDPQNSETVWLGTGESNIFRSSMAGTGVYRSQDGGKTWEHMGLEETHHIARIIVHPKNSDVVFVAACGHEYTPNSERGVYMTNNGGKSWLKVLYEDDMTGAYDLRMDPSNPDTLYASMWHRIRHAWSDPVPGDGGGIYRSDDGGRNWKRLTEGLPERGKAGRMGIDIAQSQPNTLYVIVDNHDVARKAEEGERDSYGRARQDIIKGAEVFRSDDRGETWKKTHEDGDRLLSRMFATYGWVFGQIRVDPNNPDTIFVMGVPMGKSTDGGKTFQMVNFADLHGDHHAMWIDPNNSNYIINGNDGGVNISYDGGASWKNIENLPVVQFYNVAVDNESPFNVYGSIQDNNSWMGPSRAPRFGGFADWIMIPGGEASHMAVDPNDPTVFYSESFYGTLMRSKRAEGPALKTGRRDWETKVIKPEIEGETLRGQWLAPFVVSSHDSKTIYHGMNRVFRSRDQGDTWDTISDDLTNVNPEQQGNISFATISTLSESPLKAGVIYVGTDDGRVHVTQDDGATWTEIVAGLPKSKWVSRVVASQYSEGTVFLTQNGKRDNDFQAYVYRSDDFGKTWVDISSNLPGGPVNVIREDPNKEGILYLGNDQGAFVSTNNGESWDVLGSQLPITFVHDLVIHPRDRIMVAATHGRGMFTLDVASFSGGKSVEENDEENTGRRGRPRRNSDDEDDGGE
ncbi:MAG: hypothetical protein R3C03_04685 [Pirellulaceae bacterium]